jgi:hypothetical protein
VNLLPFKFFRYQYTLMIHLIARSGVKILGFVGMENISTGEGN